MLGPAPGVVGARYQPEGVFHQQPRARLPLHVEPPRLPGGPKAGAGQSGHVTRGVHGRDLFPGEGHAARTGIDILLVPLWCLDAPSDPEADAVLLQCSPPPYVDPGSGRLVLDMAYYIIRLHICHHCW